MQALVDVQIILRTRTLHQTLAMVVQQVTNILPTYKLTVECPKYRCWKAS